MAATSSAPFLLSFLLSSLGVFVAFFPFFALTTLYLPLSLSRAISLSLSSISLQQGNVTFSCAEPMSVAATFAGSQSFLRLPGAMVGRPPGVMAAGLQFRTWNAAGLLLTFRLLAGTGVEEEEKVWLYLKKAKLHLESHRPGGTTTLELGVGQSLLHSLSISF